MTTDIELSTSHAISRYEVNQQVATAKMYPRNTGRFIEAARKLVVMSQETAEDCIYALPRAGKNIEGPSARFAEILAATYGNLRIATRIVRSDDDRFIVAQGACMDVEMNVTRTVEVHRRVTDRDNRRYTDDMVMVTANAAASIAARNAVLAAIPRPVWEPLYQLARRTAVGEGEMFVNTRARVFAYMQKLGADELRVLAFLKVDKVDDVTPDMVVLLRGVASAVKEGDVTVDDAIPPVGVQSKPEPAGTTAARLGVVPPKPPDPAKKAKSEAARTVVGQQVSEPGILAGLDPNDARPSCSHPGCLQERAVDSIMCEEHGKKK